MKALAELCDIVAQKPELFSDKLGWICSRCPPSSFYSSAPSSASTPPPRVSRSQLHGLLAVARLLSKCPSPPASARAPLLDFFRLALAADPAPALRPSFWPQSFPLDHIALFFADLLLYASIGANLSTDLASELSSSLPLAISSAIKVATIRRPGTVGELGHDLAIARAFLAAVCKNCPSINREDTERLVESLLDLCGSRNEEETTSETSYSSLNSSVSKGKAKDEEQDDSTSEVSSVATTSKGTEGFAASGGHERRSSADHSGSNEGSGPVRQEVVVFEEEAVDDLERQETACKLLVQLLDKVGELRAEQLEQVRKVVMKHLKSLPVFLRIRKREWREQGAHLRARINTKLSCSQAAITVQVKSLLSLDSDSKSTKDVFRRTLALLLDAAEACILSSWRKLRICEDVFSTVLNGISQIALSRGGQLLRVLLIPLKPLVLTTCAQADVSDNHRGPMFESVMKLSCEIIEFGWNKDRSLVDTFIMGLASSIRDRNDYEEQEEKEKDPAPVMQLNLISLLADLSSSVNKWEVVDMILPLFIESLEEGDALNPGLLRLRLLNAVSRMASLGFEKSYRETVVLMTRSYLDKIKGVVQLV